MKYVTSLPPSECLKRLTHPIGHSPMDIMHIIEYKYGLYFSGPEKKIADKSYIITDVDGSNFNVFIRHWRHLDKRARLFSSIDAGFIGEIHESDTGGSIVVCRFDKCYWFQNLYAVALVWLILLLPAILTLDISPSYWPTAFLLFGITLAMFAVGLKSCNILLEYIKDLLEIPYVKKLIRARKVRVGNVLDLITQEADGL